MPRFAPHTLPTDASRPHDLQRSSEARGQSIHPATLLGQHIRRERGMQGVRSYAAIIRDYLNETEYKEFCQSMGVPTDLQPPSANLPKREPPPQQNMGNQLQAFQMLSQLMGSQNGGGSNPLGALMGNQQSGGNALLSQLMGGQAASGGGGGGIDPMMLAQLFGSLGGK